MTRRAVLATCLAGALLGFGHAALTTPDTAAPAVECYEDGSCSNGYCAPLQLCDEAKESQQ